MKRIFLIIGVVAAVSVGTMLTGCYKDVVSPLENPNAPPQDISFNAVIKPMMETNCSKSGCHDAVPTKKPSLVAENSYAALVNGGYVNLLQPEKSTLYLSIVGGSMPPAAPLTKTQIKQVLDWIKNGAKNN